MTKITPEEIQKLTQLPWTGRISKCPALYEELKAMKINEIKFMSKKEWENTGYKAKGLKSWMTVVKNQKQRKHKSQLENYNYEVFSYMEGWTIKRIK